MLGKLGTMSYNENLFYEAKLLYEEIYCFLERDKHKREK